MSRSEPESSATLHQKNIDFPEQKEFFGIRLEKQITLVQLRGLRSYLLDRMGSWILFRAMRTCARFALSLVQDSAILVGAVASQIRVFMRWIFPHALLCAVVFRAGPFPVHSRIPDGPDDRSEQSRHHRRLGYRHQHRYGDSLPGTHQRDRGVLRHQPASGRYRIEVEKLGFKAVIQSGVTLHVQDALEVNFEMMLGSASESVTVAGESQPVDIESSTVGTVVEQRKANELPLNGRNVFNLIVLAPSVIPQGSSTGTPVGVNPFGWGNYQVSGSFGNQSAEYLDGQPLNIGYINLPVLIPTQDSIQEFKVQTSNLGAEWGRFAGGVTNLSTKGGTNYFHGEVYEYLRNRIFNANDYFLNAAGKPRPPWVQNQFGAEAGGPLRLPNYSGRNRTFWFAQLGRLPIANRRTFHCHCPHRSTSEPEISR